MCCWGVLIDVSGTLHIEDKAIDGAIEALNKLRSIPKVKIKLVTNTTKESLHSLHSRLETLGFGTKKDDLFTSLTAAQNYVIENKLRPMLFLEEDAIRDFEGIVTSDPNCVVIGLAPSQFHYSKMNQAFNLILNGSKLVAIHKARYFKTQEGLSLGPGPFVSALEYATDTKAVVLGKPSSSFFLAGLKSLDPEIPPSRSFMIGDDIRDDVIGAQECGIRGILVKTGKYRQGDEIKGQSWKVADDFTHAVDLIIEAIDLKK